MSIDDSDDGCVHGLGPRSACTICNGREKRAAAAAAEAAATVLVTFPAQFDAVCPDCGALIMIGDKIAKMGDDRYIHASCAP